MLEVLRCSLRIVSLPHFQVWHVRAWQDLAGRACLRAALHSPRSDNPSHTRRDKFFRAFLMAPPKFKKTFSSAAAMGPAECSSRGPAETTCQRSQKSTKVTCLETMPISKLQSLRSIAQSWQNYYFPNLLSCFSTCYSSEKLQAFHITGFILCRAILITWLHFSFIIFQDIFLYAQHYLLWLPWGSKSLRNSSLAIPGTVFIFLGFFLIVFIF